MTNTRIGWVGIGNMGWPMARNAKKAGLDVSVFDLDQDRLGRFADEFETGRASSLSALAEMSDLIVTIVPDGKVVRSICFGEGDSLSDNLREGMVIVDMSSSEPYGTKELAEELAKKGVTFIDAPVSGGIKGADQATLAIMVGGEDEAAIGKAMPMFEATGGNIFRCGPTGAGHAMKCLNNYLSAIGLTAAGEALVVGKEFGLDPATMIDIINVSTGRNSSTERKFHANIFPGTFDSGFATALMTKDVGIAQGLSARQNNNTPILDQLSEIWKTTAENEEFTDHTHVVEYLARLNNVNLQKKG